MARKSDSSTAKLLGDLAPGDDTPMVGRSATRDSDTPPPIAVSQLAEIIERAVKNGLPQTFRVIGEISGFTDRNHWYFKVKDAGAVIDGIMWASRTGRVGFVPQNGQQVVVTGKLEYFKPRGTLGLYVEKIEQAGQGSLEQQLQRLIAECREMGWLDVDRKRRLPAFPGHVAVITSRSGAALADVRMTMQKRCPAVALSLVDTLVQGPEAAPGVARAINWVSKHAARLGIEAVLVTRGGGSLEDLWAFNDRAVAEAIVRCSVPVVAAIGHETDTTLAELVADERASTPTQAAMRLTPDREALSEQTELAASRIREAMSRRLGVVTLANTTHAKSLVRVASAALAEKAMLLARQAAVVERARPSSQLAQRRVVLEQLANRLQGTVQDVVRTAGTAAAQRAMELPRTVRVLLTAKTENVGTLERQLVLVGPQGVLERGYSITADATGRILTNAADAPPGTEIYTRLADGSLRSTVSGGPGAEGVKFGPGGGPAAAARPVKKAKARRSSDDGSGGLFG
jgi:exodeoxyribonuclease VII large subunit